MNLYKITWDLNVCIHNFYSPQFMEGESELVILSKFIKIFEEKHPKLFPTNIKVDMVCEMDKIIK